MTAMLHSLFARGREWIDTAIAAGWLDNAALAAFQRLERATPADLFRADAVRPLVVALFGGTGVGKSSLLNRLAGAPLARTGVERPTSREVTLYCHAETPLGELPAALVERVNVARHNAALRRDVVWIDAPDIDSVETSNRELVFAWLPHVDLVVYVVSPERYRDDAGWRALLARGRLHGWMFVMNRFDEGEAGQLEDFTSILRRAGFAEPLLLATSCATARADGQLLLDGGDQFEQIERTVRDALRRHGIREIERIGIAGRLAELDDQLAECLARIGDEAVWRRLTTTFAGDAQRFAETLRSGAQWPIQAAALRFSTRNAGVVSWLLSRLRPVAEPPAQRGETPPHEIAQPLAQSEQVSGLAASLWDHWAESRLGELLDEIEVDARRCGITAEPIRTALAAVSDRARNLVVTRTETSLRAALARPGSLLQRGGRVITGFLTITAPTAALFWIWWQVFFGYYRAAGGAAAYLGSEFLIHSALLVLFSWAIPFAVDRLLAPSLEKAARTGLSEGFAAGLAELRERLEQRLDASGRAARELRAAGEALRADVAGGAEAPALAADSLLGRMIPAPRFAGRAG